MRSVGEVYSAAPGLLLGTSLNSRVPEADQKRQRLEVDEILRTLRAQPGVILADEVGMGKTFVALAVSYSVAVRSPKGPVIVMVPPNLVDKWEQDFRIFCELYLEDRQPVLVGEVEAKDLTVPSAVRYGVARHSVELMKLLDDPPRMRCHIIFLAQGAMRRRQTDKWVRLALIAEALRRHARGGAKRLIMVKRSIHRFLAELLWAIGEERAHDWGDELWEELLCNHPSAWKHIYNDALHKDKRRLADDPVPKSVVRALNRIDLYPLADGLKSMPIKSVGGRRRVSERLDEARYALRQIEKVLWKELLAQARWRSPLLVLDEAHHLKNPGTRLARVLQSPDSEHDLRTGDGAMARVFDRMLFLTATPFQLGHNELVNVLKRFGDVRWDVSELGDRARFDERLTELCNRLDDSHRCAIALQRSWSRLRPEDCTLDDDDWWPNLVSSPRDSLNGYQRSVVDAYEAAKRCRGAAEEALRPWVVRHNKGVLWNGTDIRRRQRLEGAAIASVSQREAEPTSEERQQEMASADPKKSGGLPIPSGQLLPFFLAARSAVKPGKDLLGEALSSSYEAFRLTRRDRMAAKDEQDEGPDSEPEERSPDATELLSHAGWYLEQFDDALQRCSGGAHPKVNAIVLRVVDLWEAGEKVIVFAFYRHTCRALRIHISREIERRITLTAQKRLRTLGIEATAQDIEELLAKAQRRFFDDLDSPGRRAIDAALMSIFEPYADTLGTAASAFDSNEENALAGLDVQNSSAGRRDDILDVMRRFLRVTTTLARFFPLGEMDTIEPEEAVARTLGHPDASGVSWRDKLDGFLHFLTNQCSAGERSLYIEAALRTQTGGIRVEVGEGQEDDRDGGDSTVTLANVQVATGWTLRETRSRLMRAFNTPFFPDVLVCSEVMGEGVDLQRLCRHVIHHDLAWNPSTIEQRTGRVDRLGCKAEGRHPIVVHLPYMAGTADERQYLVMTDREKWFRVVMGEDAVARLITPDATPSIPLPDAVASELRFKLGL